MTQVETIRRELLAGRSVTQRSALMDFGIMALPRRIADLKETGFPVKSEMKTNPHTGQRYASYSMDDVITDIKDLIPGNVYKLVDVKTHPFHPALVSNSQGYLFVDHVLPEMIQVTMAGERQIASAGWLKDGDFKLKYIGGMN